MHVEFAPLSGNPAIALYAASAKESVPPRACSVAAGVGTLMCSITELSPGTNYTIEGRTCLPNEKGCSSSVEKGVWTKPSGNYRH